MRSRIAAGWPGWTWASSTPTPRARAVAGRAPKPGQRGSRRWRHHRRRQRLVEARHARRIRQAQHEAARVVIGWAVTRRIGTLAVGDPRSVLNLAADPLAGTCPAGRHRSTGE